MSKRGSAVRGHAWPRALPAGSTLASAFDPRANSVGFLRLLLASLVLVDHSYPLGGFGLHPLMAATAGQEGLGGLAVAGFFVLSGFLIARSAQRSSLPRYLWHRCLRIFPAYAVCLIVTAFGFAALVWHHEHGAMTGFLTTYPQDSPTRYVWMNVKLTMNQYGIDGLLGRTPFAQSGPSQAFDGSLWTLIYEFKYYLLLGALAVGGVLNRARALVVAILVAVMLVVVLENAGVPGVGAYAPALGHDVQFARLGMFFLLGSCAYLYSGRIPLDDRLGLFSAFVVYYTLHKGGFLIVGAMAFAYLLLWLAVRLPLQRVGVKRDFSYGLYIYGFPVQQTLAEYGVHRHGQALYVVASLAGSLVLAAFSWYVVEQPFLRLKNVNPHRRRRPRPAPAPGRATQPVAAVELTGAASKA
jgi:peptidoglycan/LPS O-acetylase OafA/YrhL